MKKRFALLLTAALLISVLLGSGAMACERTGASQKSYAAASAAVQECNNLIELMIVCAQLTPCNDVPLLLISVDLLLNQTTALVRSLGYDTACEYRAYSIDGQQVWIDPLRVINPLDEPTTE